LTHQIGLCSEKSFFDAFRRLVGDLDRHLQDTDGELGVGLTRQPKAEAVVHALFGVVEQRLQSGNEV